MSSTGTGTHRGIGGAYLCTRGRTAGGVGARWDRRRRMGTESQHITSGARRSCVPQPQREVLVAEVIQALVRSRLARVDEAAGGDDEWPGVALREGKTSRSAHPLSAIPI